MERQPELMTAFEAPENAVKSIARLARAMEDAATPSALKRLSDADRSYRRTDGLVSEACRMTRKSPIEVTRDWVQAGLMAGDDLRHEAAFATCIPGRDAAALEAHCPEVGDLAEMVGSQGDERSTGIILPRLRALERAAREEAPSRQTLARQLEEIALTPDVGREAALSLLSCAYVNAEIARIEALERAATRDRPVGRGRERE